MATTPSSIGDVLHSPGDKILFSTKARLLIDVLPQGISVVEMGGNWEIGTFYVTNYKLSFVFEDSEVKETLGTIVIPLGCITSKEEPQKGKSSGGEFEFLSFHCKDMRIEHISFWASDKNKPKTTILRLLERRILAKTPDKTFGYTTKHDSDIKPFDLERELHRQNVDRLKWRILTNEATAEKERDKVTYFSNYYPYHFVVPIDETVNFYGMAQFRVMSRFPIFIYKHPRCSGTLSRTAHVKPVVLPEVVSSYVVVLPCEDDRAHCENFLKRSEGCNNLVFLEMGDQLSRDQMWSVEEEYTGCSFQFLKAQDLNAVQNSIKDIFSRTTGKSKRDEEWKDQVAATGWLEHVSVILQGSVQVVQMMENNTAVVCQSASGMDLSAIVASLAQVQIDPYYRTIEGFGILVEKDFIECGFVFGELATTKKVDCRVLPNNLSPCWVLFVDCLWQLWWHFPTAFEWNEDFLLLLVDAALSFRFGTFLYYYEKDRQKFEGKRQSSVWSFIGTNKSLFVSPFYQASSIPGTLNCTDLFTNKSRARLWNRYFLRFICRKAIINAIDNMRGAEKEDLPIIDLSSLGLSSIPPAIATLTLRKLHTLDLSNNHLTQFPLEILQLDKLHHLSLENNQIPYVTDFILSQLKSTQLMLLNLESNDLVEFPSGLSRFSQLRTLRLSNNQITSVPSLAGLSNLEVLTLSNNKLSSLDDSSITTLQKLHTLRLSFNNLTSLPSRIVNLTSLICLTLGNNQLASLPSLAPLVNLVELDLAKNGTESLPEGLPKLTSLSRLYIGYNNLQKALPTGFSQLQNLVHLDMEGNKFAEVPSDVFALQNLKRLNLDENVLQFLDMGITRLRNLTELKLKSNILSSLTPAVGALQSLTHLDVRNDTLLHLPGIIATMPKLLGGKLLYDSTKLAHEYPSERSELLSYLQSLQVSKKPCYRMKLMVVGQENVGKSTLIRCLNSKSNVKKNVNISTDGIDIDLLSLQVDLNLPGDSFPTKANVTLTTWDFAGQEVYYTTHQFFLSEHSIYLLCWNMTEPEEKSRVEYWLRSISTTAKSAPIIIVGTHGDDPRCTREYVNEASDDIRRKYFDAYPSLQDVIPVSCSNMKGLDTLKIFLEAIVKRELESYNLEVPTPWLELEKYVIEEKKRRSTPIMSKSDFLTLAHCVNIRTDKDIQSAARFLSDLGVIVYFPNDKSLRDIIVLNPEWLTNVMSSIITTKHTFCKDGVLSHSSLRQIWRPPQFSDDLHVTLIRLLEKFEITHVLANETSDFYAGSSLVPSLLPEERPTTAILKYWPEAAGENDPIFCRIYSFEFVPKGLMSRTMVRLFHFSTPLVFWRNGMLLSMKDHPSLSDSGVTIPLKDDKDSERVFVELNPTTRVITMFFRGRGYNGESQAKLFIEAFLDLLTGFFNVKWKASVPCIHCLRKQARMNPLQTTQFAETDLERAAIVPGAKVTCGDVQVSVSELVPDIAMTQAEGSRILCEELEVGEQVGEGGYALVYKGTYRGQLVAVKKIKIEKHADGEDDSALLVALSEFRREVWIMSNLRHPNVVNLIGFTISPYYSLVTEFISFGNLYDYIHDKSKSLTERLYLRCAVDIAKGCAFMHGLRPPIIHRDLKTPNVLMSDAVETAPVVCKVADFGTCQALASTTKGRIVSNPIWLAPEIMKQKEYTEKADVYSFGVMLWELCTREDFFGEVNFMSAIEDNVRRGKRPPIPTSIPSEFQELITVCWAQKPDQRPTFSDCVTRLSVLLMKLHPDLGTIALSEENRQVAAKSQENHFLRLTTSRSQRGLDTLASISMSSSPPTKPVLGMPVPLSSSPSPGSNISTPGSPRGLFAASPGTTSRRNLPLIGSDRKAQPQRAVPQRILLHDAQARAKEAYKDRPQEFQEITTRLPAGITCLLSTNYFEGGVSVAEVWCGCSNGQIVIFDSKRKERSLSAHTKSVLAMAVVDEFVWTSGDDDTLVTWSLKTKSKVSELRPCSGFTSLVFLRPNFWCSTVSSEVVLIDPKKTNFKRREELNIGQIHSLLATDSTLWLGCDKAIVQYSTKTWKIERSLPGHAKPVTHLLIVDGKELWSCSKDESIKVWNLMDGHLLATLDGHRNAVCRMVQVKGLVWSCSMDCAVIAWDIQTKKQTKMYSGFHYGGITSLILHSDGHLWSGSIAKSLSCFYPS